MCGIVFIMPCRSPRNHVTTSLAWHDIGAWHWGERMTRVASKRQSVSQGAREVMLMVEAASTVDSASTGLRFAHLTILDEQPVDRVVKRAPEHATRPDERRDLRPMHAVAAHRQANVRLALPVLAVRVAQVDGQKRDEHLVVRRVRVDGRVVDVARSARVACGKTRRQPNGDHARWACSCARSRSADHAAQQAVGSHRVRVQREKQWGTEHAAGRPAQVRRVHPLMSYPSISITRNGSYASGPVAWLSRDLATITKRPPWPPATYLQHTQWRHTVRCRGAVSEESALNAVGVRALCASPRGHSW
jgi:hypothetical protein